MTYITRIVVRHPELTEDRTIAAIAHLERTLSAECLSWRCDAERGAASVKLALSAFQTSQAVEAAAATSFVVAPGLTSATVNREG